MSKTILLNNTGTPVTYDIVVPTQNTGGSGTGDVFENADTQDAVSTNAVIKYINVHIQATVRKDVSPANPGWVEYAFFYRMEQQTTPTINGAFTSDNGTQTLGDLATNIYRDKCVWTGSIPVSEQIPMTQNIALKCPPKFCKWKRGMYLQLVIFFRSSNSTDTTSSARIILSHNYKVYS